MIGLAIAGFVAFGAVLVLVGANQAPLAAALELDLAESGLLASALALGIGTGIVGSGPVVDRWPRQPLFLLLQRPGQVARSVRGGLPTGRPARPGGGRRRGLGRLDRRR